MCVKVCISVYECVCFSVWVGLFQNKTHSELLLLSTKAGGLNSFVILLYSLFRSSCGRQSRTEARPRSVGPSDCCVHSEMEKAKLVMMHWGKNSLLMIYLYIIDYIIVLIFIIDIVIDVVMILRIFSCKGHICISTTSKTE